MNQPTPITDFLRHVVATIAYRGGKAIRDAPAGFGDFRVGPTSRTPTEILAHIGDLLRWAIWLADGEHRWEQADAGSWDEQVARFHTLMAELDDRLALDPLLSEDWGAERVFQGPLADILTHVGQIAMLRRLADSPIRGENFARADITPGRVGPDQPPPRKEFD